MKPPTKSAQLQAIADRIREHLKRFEKDPEINKPSKYMHQGAEREGSPMVYCPNSWQAAGRYVYVKYICYQCENRFSPQEAQEYLDWLDAGGIGKHFQMNREKS